VLLRRKSFVSKKLWLGAESNRRHEDFQSSALPTELPSRMKRGREYERASGPRKRKLDHLLITCCTAASGPRGFHCFDSSDMASDRQLDWTAADLAVLNGRVIANRGVRTGCKPSSAVRTNHLDIFFEVHGLS
jgi:hypothetical protein